MNRSHLGTYSLAMIVVSSMIGAGVYTTSGFALGDLGDPRWVLAAWAIGGIIAICGAIGFAQLASRLCENGGEYLYLSRAIHPAAGFVAGWISMVAGFTGAAAFAALAFDNYALPTPARPTWLPPGTLAALLVAVCTAAHCFRTGPGIIGQNIAVAIKLTLLGLFLAIAFYWRDRWQGGSPPPGVADEPATGWMPFATSVMWISLSYSGFNAAIYLAGEARGGAKSVGRSMVTATIVVTLIYCLMNYVFLYSTPHPQIVGRQDIAAAVARHLGGDALASLVRILICVGLATSVSSILIAGPRVYARMSRDGLLPRFFDSDTPPPTASVLVQGIAIVALIFASDLRELLSYLGMTLSLSAAATVSTLAIGRSATRRTTIAGFFAAVYVVATLVIAGLAAIHRPAEAAAFAATVAVGLVLYGVSIKLFGGFRPGLQ